MNAARAIVGYGAPILHRPVRQVDDFGTELAELLAVMEASMLAFGGVGLAANQIGVDAAVFVYRCADSSGRVAAGHVVNPLLLEPADSALVMEAEGCLSLPGRYAAVPRRSTATVVGVDLDGAGVEVVGTGLLARCLQHEVDHLAGLTFVDRLPARPRRELLAELPLISDSTAD